MAFPSVANVPGSHLYTPSRREPVLRNFQDSALAVERVTIPGVGDLRAIDATMKEIIWVGGTQGKVALSLDKGRSWRSFSPSDGDEGIYYDFRAISALDDNTACAMSVGESEHGLSKVFRTADRGRSWSPVLCPQEEGLFFNAMKFWDNERGIILGDPHNGQFVFYKTENGGKNWTRLIPYSLPPALPKEAVFAASNSCLAVHSNGVAWFCTGRGNAARLFSSRDYGLNWVASVVPMSLQSETAGLFSISFKNEKEGIAVGGDFKSKYDFRSPNVFTTENGGISWSPIDSKELSGHYLSCVSYNAKKELYVVDGSSGTYNALTFAENRGYAVGPNQQLAIFNT